MEKKYVLQAVTDGKRLLADFWSEDHEGWTSVHENATVYHSTAAARRARRKAKIFLPVLADDVVVVECV